MRNPRLRLLLACTASLLAASPLLLAQLPTWPTAATLSICRAGLTGRVVVIQDGLSVSDCSTGGAVGTARHSVMCLCDQDGAGGYVWRAIGSGGGGGGSIDSITASAPITSTGGSDPVLGCAAGSTSARGCVELATSAETTAGLVVQASDDRLTNSRAPSGSASGDLTGTYPGPTVAANSVALGTDTTGNYAAGDAEAGAATNVLDGLIVNADVNASAGIALSKLAAATASKCARFDSAGVLVAASGDCSAGDTGGSAPDPLTVSTVQGGTGSGGELVLLSTTNATKGEICFDGSTSADPAWKAITLGGGPAFRAVNCTFSAGAGLVANIFAIPNDTTPMFFVANNGEVRIEAAASYGIASDGNAMTDAADTKLTRASAGIWKVTNTLQLQDPGSKPTCEAATRFTLWADAGGAGVADTLEICTKDATDTYAWRAFTLL